MTASFHEIRFPDDISYGATGGPEYSTDLIITASGGENRNQNWLLPKAKYQVGHGVKTQAQLNKLIAFFRARKGRAFGFRFKDWADFKATAQPINSIADLTFQLIKTYTDDAGYTEERPITKPVAGTLQVYFAGVLQDPAIATMDATTGLVTLTSGPAEGQAITVDFEFDLPARFDTDYMPVNIQSFNVYSWESIPVVELRL